MKKNISSLLMILLMMCSFFSCTQDEALEYNQPSNGKGQLSLEAMQVTVKAPQLVTRNEGIDPSSYRVKIINTHSQEVAFESTYEDVPSIIELPVGMYQLKVDSHEPVQAAFDAPYYVAEEAFEIEQGVVTKVGKQVCTLANIRVSILFEEDLLPYLGDDVQVALEMGNAQMVLAYDDTRSAYFMPNQENNVLIATLTGTVDGEPFNMTQTIVDVKAGEYRLLTFSASSGNDLIAEGEIQLGIKIDLNVTKVDHNVDVAIEEDILDEDDDQNPGEGGQAAAPVIEGVGFDLSEEQVFGPSGATIQVNMSSEAGFAHLFVEIDSETLTPEVLSSVGLASSFDLANPGVLETALTGLGFPVGAAVIGEKELLFDISQFTSLLGAFGPAHHNFILRVVDQADPAQETTQTLRLQNTDEETTTPEEKPALTIAGQGFNIDEQQYVPEGGSTIVVDIDAEAGLSHVFVEIESETLTPEVLSSVGLASSFDLANPGALETALSGLGFPVGAAVIGQTELTFDISQFTSLLGAFGPAVHKFHLRVVDQVDPAQEVVKTLQLKND